MLKKLDDEFVGIFIAALKKANEKLNEHSRITERVLVVLYVKYLAFGIPIPTIIHANEIAKALSTPGHEVTEQMVTEALRILVIEGFLPLGTATPVYTKPEELTETEVVGL